MFCRRCAYDLRGQKDSRCPECGTPFNILDAHSYFKTMPSGASLWVERNRGLVTVATSALLIAWLVTTTCNHPVRLLHVRPFGTMWYSVNLRLIAVEWQLQNPIADKLKKFDVQLARSSCPASYSPWGDSTALTWRARCSAWANATARVFVPLGVYSILMMGIGHPRAKRFMRVLFILSVVLLVTAILALPIAGWLWPPSLNYLDDYVYLLITEQPLRSLRIIAYGRNLCRLTEGLQRPVAFEDGSIDFLPESKFRQRLGEQEGAPTGK